MKVLILKPRMRCRETLFGAEYNRIVGEIKENKITVIDPDLFDYEIVEIDSVFTKESNGKPSIFKGYSSAGIFPTRDEAEDFIKTLQEVIDEYGYLSVDQLCSLQGVIPNYNDDKKGWTSLTYRIESRYDTKVSKDFYYELLLTEPFTFYKGD